MVIDFNLYIIATTMYIQKFILLNFTCYRTVIVLARSDKVECIPTHLWCFHVIAKEQEKNDIIYIKMVKYLGNTVINTLNNHCSNLISS